MRILVIDEEFPYPLDSGKRIRSFNLIRRLAARAEVHYLAYGAAHSAAAEACAAAGIHPLPVPGGLPPNSGPGFYARLAANLLSPRPYIVARHYSRRFQHALDRTVAALRPDLVLCEWTPYAAFVEHLTSIPRVIVAHNLEQRIWRRYWENEPRGPKRAYIGHQARKVADFEQHAFAGVEGAVAVSREEAEAIGAAHSALRVAVVENGVDLDFFRAQSCSVEAETLVFVGAMHWRPNQDAVAHFVTEVLPRLQQRHPNLRFDVVGQAPPPEIRRLDERPGVRILGRVDDVRPYVAAATACVVPLRIGGGTRLKILEALAMKKAVVATTIGAEGLELDEGEHILRADTPTVMAEAITRVCGDPALRERLGRQGRQRVEERYGWDALAAKLATFLTQFANSPTYG